jgi:adenosylhomocysteine nucleosidase
LQVQNFALQSAFLSAKKLQNLIMRQKIIGIMGAMPEEIMGVVGLLTEIQAFSVSKRTYYTGKMDGISSVVVISGWGKVAAAATVSTLIHKFNITELIFTGVAGAIHPELKIGDIVLASRLMQHDMDARPFIPRYEIPLVGKTFFGSPESNLNSASEAIRKLLADKQLSLEIEEDDLNRFGIHNPQLHIGDVASGDKFFSDDADKIELHKNLPTILCVEMEGAAVAQVCDENDIPFTVIRTISDASDNNSVIDFSLFIKNVASKYSVIVIRNLFGRMAD